MKLRKRDLLACVVLLVGVVLAAVAGRASAGSVNHVMTDGYAYALYGDCDVPFPADGTTCHETEITVFKESVSAYGDSNAAPQNPWVLLVDHIVTAWNGGNFTVLDYHAGVTTDVNVTFDNAQLSALAAQGTVTMDDNSTVSVNVAWAASGPVVRYGNNGPDSGAPQRHYVDRCVTQNANAHERSRRALMTGTVNGSAVQSYQLDFAGFLAKGHYVFLTADHKGAC